LYEGLHGSRLMDDECKVIGIALYNDRARAFADLGLTP
jgi:hypothetical protein